MQKLEGEALRNLEPQLTPSFNCGLFFSKEAHPDNRSFLSATQHFFAAHPNLTWKTTTDSGLVLPPLHELASLPDIAVQHRPCLGGDRNRTTSSKLGMTVTLWLNTLTLRFLRSRVTARPHSHALSVFAVRTPSWPSYPSQNLPRLARAGQIPLRLALCNLSCRTWTNRLPLYYLPNASTANST